MHIDSYQFGKIVIDGTAYTSDCLIISGSVKDNWWRKQGHLLTPEDLETVIETRPRILVVGCGASGMMKISKDTEKLLQEHSIELFETNTNNAVEKFNELSEKGEKVVAAFHLTC